MSDITGLQMAEYLNIGPSPYTLLFQQIFDILKPELKVVEAKDIEDGEIEETEDEEEDKDVIIVDDDDNIKDIGETGDKEVSHGKPCVATAELPPVSLAGLPPPTSQPNPSLFTLGLPFPSASRRLPSASWEIPSSFLPRHSSPSLLLSPGESCILFPEKFQRTRKRFGRPKGLTSRCYMASTPTPRG